MAGKASDFEAIRTLELSKPVRFAGADIDELRFREPTGKLLSVIEANQSNPKNGQSLPLLAYFTGLDIGALERMAFADTLKAVEIVGELMVASGLVTDDEGGLGKD